MDSNFFPFISNLKNNTHHEQFMCLQIYCDTNNEILKDHYVKAANVHNNKIFNDPHFYDAGFDIFLPETEDKWEQEHFGNGKRFLSTSTINKITYNHSNKVDFKIKCCARIFHIKPTLDSSSPLFYYTPFYTYARSSISKTPLRLANNQGIIDAGYRGNIIGMFDCINQIKYKNNDYDDCDFYVEPYTRLLQICSPNLLPIYIQIVDKMEDLGPDTSRNDKGIGSSGL
jgi:hypothetical protein